MLTKDYKGRRRAEHKRRLTYAITGLLLLMLLSTLSGCRSREEVKAGVYEALEEERQDQQEQIEAQVVDVSQMFVLAPQANRELSLEVRYALRIYFTRFNVPQFWQASVTDDFINRVYEWSTGDGSGEASRAEMLAALADYEQDSAQLLLVKVDRYQEISETEIDFHVLRQWEGNQRDDTYYTLIREEGEWKVNNRFDRSEAPL